MSRETIAKSLKRLREQSGLTADQVGRLVGKSGKTVNAWENNRGQPDAEMLIKLCDIYNVDDILAEFREDTTKAPFAISDHEKAVILCYRNKPEMQAAVDTLLSVPQTVTPEKTYQIKKVARNGDFEEKTITESELNAIKNLPDVDDF